MAASLRHFEFKAERALSFSVASALTIISPLASSLTGENGAREGTWDPCRSVGPLAAECDERNVPRVEGRVGRRTMERNDQPSQPEPNYSAHVGPSRGETRERKYPAMPCTRTSYRHDEFLQPDHKSRASLNAHIA